MSYLFKNSKAIKTSRSVNYFRYMTRIWSSAKNTSLLEIVLDDQNSDILKLREHS